MDNDIIAAIATPVGTGGISIIRISGEGSCALAGRLFNLPDGRGLDFEKVPTHTIHYGYIHEGDVILDEVLVSVMRAPRSYTAEDVVEINCHGGIYVTSRVLKAVLSEGARLAEPGEFTKRAFMNGRIDLTRAESVMDLIASKNEFLRENSIKGLKGVLYDKIRALRERIIHETAYIEAALDDPENYSLDGYGQSLLKKIEGIKGEIDSMTASSENARIASEGIDTCIAGRPNVGKSSIMNLLSGEERAIVTDIAGTTRDAIDCRIRLDDMIINLTDTAGLRRTDDPVEKMGVEKSYSILKRSQLVLFVVDSSSKLEDEDMEIASALDGKNTIVLLNKSDLPHEVSPEDMAGIINAGCVYFSARTGEGLREMADMVKEKFFSGLLRDTDDIYITGIRQAGQLKAASESLGRVIESVRSGMSEDVYTVDLMDAYAYLGSITGEDTSEDLAERIFSEFCMGK